MKFRGLCEGRGYPVLRIGVTDAEVGTAGLEVQDLFTVVARRAARRATARTLPDALRPGRRELIHFGRLAGTDLLRP